MIIYQVVLLASKPKVLMDENEFFDRKVRGVVLSKGLFELNIHKSLERALAFSKWSESTQIYSVVWPHSQTYFGKDCF